MADTVTSYHGDAAPLGALLIGAGRANQAIARVLRERGIPIVGAVGRGSATLGADLGTLSGAEPWAIPVVDSLPDLSRLEGNLVAFLATGSQLRDQEEHLAQCAAAGIDVITLAEQSMAPWVCDPGVADRIDATARAAGTTVMPGGHTDALWIQLPILLAGIPGRLESIRGSGTRPLLLRAPNDYSRLRLGENPEPGTPPTTPEIPGGAAYSALHAVASCLGLGVIAEEAFNHPLTSSKDQTIQGHDKQLRFLPCGSISGISRTIVLHTREGIVLSFEDKAVAGAASREEWLIGGSPQVAFTVSVGGGLASTATQAVNRIPTVLSAQPGFQVPAWDLGPVPPYLGPGNAGIRT